MHLGATELFHSVTPTGSGYIYSRAKFWKFLRNPFARAIARSAIEGLRIVLLVASRLLSLVSTAVNGILPRRCRCSEFIAELGYGLDHSAIPVRFLAHCVHYDSYHD